RLTSQVRNDRGSPDAGSEQILGRDPDSCKIFFGLHPIVAETEEAAAQKRAAMMENASLEAGLAYVSHTLAVDLSELDPNTPLPRMEIRGVQGRQAQYYAAGRLPTVRQMAQHTASLETYPVWGTPEQVADQLGHLMEMVGGDGIAIRSGVTPSVMVDFVDGVVPVLQRRGLARTEYSGSTLREHLMEF
ncbi:MAG: LLM class flavin-dependent oxidoreductase, partial [Chloroflexi bacterium]|nr:LLM class flavin-dependent oxidoreductase [Chloroflexota bacterium]